MRLSSPGNLRLRTVTLYLLAIGSAGLSAAMLAGLGCGGTSTTDGPSLTMTPSRKTQVADGASSVTIGIVAVESDGKTPGAGSVAVTADAGNLNGAPNAAVVDLVDGQVMVTYSCNASSDPACFGPQTVQAKWKGASATTKVTFVGADGGSGQGDGGSPAFLLDDHGMHVLGTLVEGQDGVDVFCNLAYPNNPSAGFGKETAAKGMAIRKSDGKLFYVRGGSNFPGELRVFTADAAPYKTSTWNWAYPSAPESNDALVPAPACSSFGVSRFVIQAGTGDIFYGCWGGGLYDLYDKNGQRRGCSSSPIEAIGEDGAAICGQSVVSAAGVETPITGGYESSVGQARHVRPRPGGGFWAVTGNGGTFDRWFIDSRGSSVKEGTYPDVSNTYRILNNGILSALSPAGDLFAWVLLSSRNDDMHDRIIRFDASFQATSLVYDESTNPMCKLHGFWFIPAI